MTNTHEKPGVGTWAAQIEERLTALEKDSHSPKPLDAALAKLIDENLRRCSHGYIHITCGDCNNIGGRR